MERKVVFKSWVDSKEPAREFVYPESYVRASGRDPDSLRDMIDIERILTEAIKKDTGSEDVVVEFIGCVVG